MAGNDFKQSCWLGTDWKNGNIRYSWRRNAIRISDYVEPTDNVALLFIAQDSVIPGGYLDGGSLVEAAIDDLYLYRKADSIPDTTGNVAIENISELIYHVYPNPAQDNLNISFNNFSSASVDIKLCNSIGDIIYSEVINLSSKNSCTLNTSPFAAGVYALIVSDDYKSARQHIVISR